MRRKTRGIILRRQKKYEFVIRHSSFVIRMITFLNGKLVEALPTQVVVDVNGVGYEVLIPLSSFDKIPAPGQPVKLLTQLVVREDAHILYGFATVAERDLFRLLINNVSGIGPKTALNIFCLLYTSDAADEEDSV